MALQLNLMPNVPAGHTMVIGWLRMSVHPRTAFIVYVFGNLDLYGIRASQWISSNEVIITPCLPHLVGKNPTNFKVK